MKSQVYQVRKWTNIVPDNVTFKNCFKVRKVEEGRTLVPIPHCFTFMKRSGQGLRPAFNCTRGLPRDGVETSERVPRGMRQGDRLEDVFCLVKSELSSKSLCQDPLLVFPGCLLGTSQHFLRAANSSTLLEPLHLEPQRRIELQKLRDMIKMDFPSMSRAVQWYSSVLARPEAVDLTAEPYTQLTFLQHPNADDHRLRDFQLGPRPVPVKPHLLQVVFHRG